MERRSLDDFPKDVRDSVYEIIARAAVRKAKHTGSGGDMSNIAVDAKPNPSIDRIAAAMNRYLVPAAQNQSRSDFSILNNVIDKEQNMKYPLKPAEMSDEAWERLHDRIAELQLKYAERMKDKPS